jgi:predicted Zn-dependent protease
MRFFSRLRNLTQPRAKRSLPTPTRLEVEPLESRLVPYSVSGNAWPHPELVTLSFVPDGTNVNGQSSNLFATFNARFGSTAAWQNEILRAAQVWAQQTNLNFALVSDNGADSGAGSYQQGDPGFGDIRIGGYYFGSNSLATAFMPPPINNYSIAGDFNFNTGQTFHIGDNYDLFTVAVHEIGHALGLNHSTATSAVMFSMYNNIKTGLNSDDIYGIRNIYSAGLTRKADAYDAVASNGSTASASVITSLIDPSTQTAVLSNLDVTSTMDTD